VEQNKNIHIQQHLAHQIHFTQKILSHVMMTISIVPAGRVYQNVEETQAGCCLTVPLPVDSVISVKISITIALIGLDRVNATKTNNTWIFTAKSLVVYAVVVLPHPQHQGPLQLKDQQLQGDPQPQEDLRHRSVETENINAKLGPSMATVRHQNIIII